MTGTLNRLSLQLDVESMVRDLTARLNFFFVDEVDRLVGTLNGFDFAYASGSFKKELVESGADFIKFKVGSDHWYAFIVEYGRGTSMDINNPFLASYMDSGYYNPYRVHGDIRTWGYGPYEVPDWFGGKGTVEKMGHGAPGIKIPEDKLIATPLPPNHFLRDALERTKETLRETLREAYRTFPFGFYLKGGG